MEVIDEKSEDLKRIEKVADLLDTRFRLPGTKFDFGLDPVIGLIPVLGDLSTLIMSAGLVYMISKHGASGKVKLMMIGNVLIDAVIGSIPVLGAIFDFGYKANSKNVNLLKKHYREGKHQGSGKGIILLITITFVLLLASLIYGIYKLLAYLF